MSVFKTTYKGEIFDSVVWKTDREEYSSSIRTLFYNYEVFNNLDLFGVDQVYLLLYINKRYITLDEIFKLNIHPLYKYKFVYRFCNIDEFDIRSLFIGMCTIVIDFLKTGKCTKEAKEIVNICTLYIDNIGIVEEHRGASMNTSKISSTIKIKRESSYKNILPTAIEKRLEDHLKTFIQNLYTI